MHKEHFANIAKHHAQIASITVVLAMLCGCASLAPTPAPPAIACTMRFKMLSRSEDQERVERSIRTIALGPVTKSGTLAYPEYRFHVLRMADLDDLLPRLMYDSGGGIFAAQRQALNLNSAGIAFNFDSTDITASTTTTVTFNVKPGSRLYYKTPGEIESDITAKVGKDGRVTLPVTLKEGQKFIYARAVKDSVTRYISINVFTSEVTDISQRTY